MKLKIMTYNIAGGRDYSDPGVKPPVHPDACISVIREEAPDICGLNEVDYTLPRSGRVKLAEHIGNSLGYESRFAPAVTWVPGTYGNGFLSRHPILETEIFPIPDPTDRSEPAYYDSRVILHAVVDFGGKPADVFVTHLGLAKAEKESGIRTLEALIQDASHPVILMGDFNLEPDAPLLQPIRALLRDTYDVYPNQADFTWPSYRDIMKPGERMQKIDYIFVSREVRVHSVAIPAPHASDHKPYIATIELP